MLTIRERSIAAAVAVFVALSCVTTSISVMQTVPSPYAAAVPTVR